MSISTIAKNVGGAIIKNAPTILTSLSVAGVVSTAALTAKAAVSANDILKNSHELEELDLKTKIKLTWREYIPSIIMGGITIACVISANTISLRRTAALAGMYSLTEKALKDYKDEAAKLFGDKKAREVEDKVHETRIKENPPKSGDIIMTGKSTTLFYEPLSARYFKSDVNTIQSCVNHLNCQLMDESTLSVNEFYWGVGLEPCEFGRYNVWDISRGLIDVDFSAHMTENYEPCLSLVFRTQPRYFN